MKPHVLQLVAVAAGAAVTYTVGYAVGSAEERRTHATALATVHAAGEAVGWDRARATLQPTIATCMPLWFSSDTKSFERAAAPMCAALAKQKAPAVEARQ